MSKIKSSDYELLSQEEQILLRPDTVIGSMLEKSAMLWVPIDGKFQKKLIRWTPGFIKLFDEILTNASDHAQREVGVKEIKINVSIGDKIWKMDVWNDGEGIPIVKNDKHNLWIPDMVLGRLNSGSNYDDTKLRWGAGRNGVGSGAVSIFSKKFVIDCADGKKSFYSENLDNSKIRTEPLIKSSKKSYTRIYWEPDVDRFEINHPYEVLLLIERRIWDVAAFNPNIKIWFNGALIPINNFKDWANSFDKFNILWEDEHHQLGLSLSDEYSQDSIVNGNTTWSGGTHVDGFINQIIKRILEDKKAEKRVKPNQLKNIFHIHLISKVINPQFDTQSKETLYSKISIPQIDKSFFKKLYNSEINESIDDIINDVDKKLLLSLNKKAAGKNLKIDKLVDAHKAGTKDSEKCYLAISEGDSSKGIVLTGINEIGRDYWGVFPIKGRSLNVRNVDNDKISKNEEIKNIIKILGLVPGKKYKSLSELRYGKIVFFTDADHFGISIKGLLLNLFHLMWSELLELGFCYEFITPIVKAKKGNKVKDFYDIGQMKLEDLSDWKTKYYKGLGTITALEIKEMFKNIDKHLIRFNYDELRDSNKIDMVFNKKRADDRKNWMLSTLPDILSKSGSIDIDKFIDNEFIHFSNYDNTISIPDLMDGFKPSQRKAVWVALERNLKDEVKVAQFGASVAEKTHYNHGENNMFETIIKMAQNHNCSNWINLFEPVGNFGNRVNPDAWASPRYIYTHLSKWSDLIFKREDLEILDDNYEEGFKIEPKFLLPIIPLILVNGISGIGTGWSTNIPNFDPVNIIDYIRKKLGDSVRSSVIKPNWRGWNGKLELSDGKWIAKGKLEKVGNYYWVKEIKPSRSIDQFISHLDELEEKGLLKSYLDMSKDDIPNIKLEGLVDYKKLDLVENISTTNMNYWYGCKITKSESPEEIVDIWFEERLFWYGKRMDSVIEKLTNKLDRSNMIWKFIDLVINNKLELRKRKLDDVINQLESLNFIKIDNSYNYLLNIPAISFTKEKSDFYKNMWLDCKNQLSEYKKLTPQSIWLSELSLLRKELVKG